MKFVIDTIADYYKQDFLNKEIKFELLFKIFYKNNNIDLFYLRADWKYQYLKLNI
jgi:hypothetical protein